jgi:hypothetical protein
MAGVYRPRHPERTVLYRVLSHHLDRFLTEYEGLVLASWANYSNRGKGDIDGVARRGREEPTDPGGCRASSAALARNTGILDMENGSLGLVGAGWRRMIKAKDKVKD